MSAFVTSGQPRPPRRIVHPGPVHPDRIESFAAPMISGEIVLPAGRVLIEAIAESLAPQRIKSAALDLKGLCLGPMDFVMPTFSTSPDHVAYYSDTYHLENPISVEEGTATYGIKDDAPFLHGHILWSGPHGEDCGGHVLPDATRIAQTSTIRFKGCTDIRMEAIFDPETNFTLFGPSAWVGTDGDLIVARLRPNEDLIAAIENIAQSRNIERARVLSLIGSTVGAQFEGGPIVDKIPTETLGLSGTITRNQGGHDVDLTIALIDADGNIHRGRPVRGENPVLICTELFIEHLD